WGPGAVLLHAPRGRRGRQAGEEREETGEIGTPDHGADREAGERHHEEAGDRGGEEAGDGGGEETGDQWHQETDHGGRQETDHRARQTGREESNQTRRRLNTAGALLNAEPGASTLLAPGSLLFQVRIGPCSWVCPSRTLKS